MEDLRTRAQLVSAPARAGAGAVGTVVTRAEVAEATARNEFPATFLLDLDRVETGEAGEVMAHARVAVDWDEQTLRQLLASTDADEFTLWFDELELARAFDDDVEAHGLREKAAVIAIALTAAGASAGPSLASVTAPGAGGGSGNVQAPIASAGGGGSVQAPGAGGGSGNVQAPTASAGGGGSVQAPGAGGGSGNVQAPTASAGGGGSVQAPGAGGGSGGTAPAVTAQGGGASDSELAAIAGAGVLLISAAGFGVARRRTRPGQPA